MPLGKNIKYCRKQLGISQGELAEILGCKSQTTVSSWEHKIAFPKRSMVRQMANIFDREIEEMYDVDLEEKDKELLGFQLTEEEKLFLVRFRQLPEIVQKSINAAINEAYHFREE